MRLVREVISRKLIEDMIKLELFDHKHILRDRCFFHVGSCSPYFFDKREQRLFHLTSLFLSLGRMIARHELIYRKSTERNIGLRKDVKHIELQRCGTFLSNWKYLEPT